ncbi:MAG: cupin domain-containing protein [Verrucomicrobia bacterium]|nr:cupin domain-containing protein [Verrucomicrobiota bacterium]
MPSAAEIIAALQLAPLPNEGGFFRQTYVSAATLPGGRPAGTAIYFLLTPEDFSALHRLHTEEIWHFYAGDTVEHLILDPTTGEGRQTLLGADCLRGLTPQLAVPGGTWQGARLVAGGAWALLGCTMSPGWEEREFALGGRDALVARFPAWAADIETLTR